MPAIDSGCAFAEVPMRASPLVAAFASCLLAGAAPAAQLNDTGMVRCVDHDANLGLQCTGTGQDGETGRDTRFRSNRNGAYGFQFQKVCNSGELAGEGQCPASPPLGPGADDWACTKDRVTGLTWEIKTTDGGLRDRDTSYPYSATPAYLDQVNASALCGRTDWRLPTRFEVQSVVWYGRGVPDHDPVVDPNWLPNLVLEPYWSQSPPPPGYPNAMTVDARDGSIFFDEDPAWLMAVSGLTGNHQFSLQASGDEVVDDVNHLAWRRCVEGMDWDGQGCSGTFRRFTWQGALDRAARQSQATGTTWRVPTVKELGTLVSPGIDGPTIDRQLFPGTPRLSTWTSTPFALQSSTTSSQSWTVGFGRPGAVLAGDVGSRYSVRLVRDLE
jgi:hypothetical protein